MPGTDLITKRLYDLSVSNESLFQQIREKAWDRVMARLNDPEPISETQLFRLFSEMNKLQFTMESKVHEHRDEREHEIYDLIQNDGIPLEHRQELLAELEARGMDVGKYREVLTKGASNGSSQPSGRE
jgi:hypothetical protein